MSDTSSWRLLLTRASGKWQIPLLALSFIILPASVFLLRPDPHKTSLAEAASTLELFVRAEMYDLALAFGQEVLKRPECAGGPCAPVHLQLARTKYRVAAEDGWRSRAALDAIIEHYREAAAYGAPMTAIDFERLGRALERTGNVVLALQWLEEAIRAGATNPLAIKKHIHEARRDREHAGPDELAPDLDALLKEIPENDPGLLAWGLEEKIEILDAQGRIDQAEPILESYRDRGSDGTLPDELEYLHGFVLYKLGRFNEAEVLLRTLRNRVPADSAISAKAGWLLGRVVLFDDGPKRPEEAMSFFRDVLAHHPVGPYATACRLGIAEAQVHLERTEAAIGAYSDVVADLALDGDTRLVNHDTLRASLAVMAEQRRQLGQLAAAEAYAKLAVNLVDPEDIEQTALHMQQLGAIARDHAEQLVQAEDASKPLAASDAGDRAGTVRDSFRAAAATFGKLAELPLQDERRVADAAWLAAELTAKAGDRSEAIRLYRKFLENRPSHSLVPRALLRIGQLQQAAGRLKEAVEAFQECHRRFPETLDGIRTLVPLARCHLAMGADELDLAEKTLRIVLEDSDVFTPEAPEFGDALFLLGDVLQRKQDYERSVTVLQEALDRYPSDPRVWRARFLLADSYRQSALALRRDAQTAQFGGEIEAIRRDSSQRFGQARRWFREMIDEYERRGSGQLNRLERMYLRHAYFYEADCYFDAQEYDVALKLYEEAAGTFKESVSALSAYVQIINCHAFLGQPREARAALARAQVLARAMPEESFAISVSPERKQDWVGYFEWLAATDLF